MTDEKMYCARHPSQETALTCATCGTPICPRCMVVTPVGMKCPKCGRNTNSALTKVPPHRFVLAFVTSMLTGVGALVLSEIGLFAIFLATMYGYFAGGIILKASGMKRGLKLEIASGIGVVLGALIPKIGLYFMARHAVPSAHLSVISLIDLYALVVVGVTTACVVSKIRYL